MSKTIDLTTERDTVPGTVPYQPRPFIRIGGKVRVRAFGAFWRPRTVALALLALAVVGYGAVRLLLAER